MNRFHANENKCNSFTISFLVQPQMLFATNLSLFQFWGSLPAYLHFFSWHRFSLHSICDQSSHIWWLCLHVWEHTSLQNDATADFDFTYVQLWQHNALEERHDISINKIQNIYIHFQSTWNEFLSRPLIWRYFEFMFLRSLSHVFY